MLDIPFFATYLLVKRTDYLVILGDDIFNLKQPVLLPVVSDQIGRGDSIVSHSMNHASMATP